ncbi:PTS glucose transporter subunit IIA [Lactococcus nasutitermitis]|uniref:PTS glucose transporter subunit IIA n=1 Tax=Lactococcus nasutitermitis TaxID=1652957 RepID=A0ABV9JBT0_9LACT|nr:PTS glucose transporter subunit IIA [Lactococcus nasutitermitis]
MFGFGKKKKELIDDSKLYAPVSGELVKLDTVSDPIFAQKVMGDGFAIEPDSGKILSPVAGEITVKQGHAVGFKRVDGLEVLLHLGIDTVSLNGAPFTLKVAVGDIVEAGDELGKADWSQVEAAGLPKTTMVLVTNTADKLAHLTVNYGPTTAGTVVGEAQAK